MAGVMWGIASDRYGRRLCLLLSMMNIAVFGVLLGFSTSFTMAVLLRLAIGLGEHSRCVLPGAMLGALTNVVSVCSKLCSLILRQTKREEY